MYASVGLPMRDRVVGGEINHHVVEASSQSGSKQGVGVYSHAEYFVVPSAELGHVDISCKAVIFALV